MALSGLARIGLALGLPALVLTAAGAGAAPATAWRSLGGSLSADPQGWAFSPTIAAAPDGTIYAAWAQHTGPSNWQLVGIYAKRWANGAWEGLGGRIGNVRRGYEAQNVTGYAPSLALLGSVPYVAWYEGGGYGWGQMTGVGIRSSVFVAHWDGRRWLFDRNATMPNGALNTAPSAAARTPRLAVIDGILHAAWIETRRIPNSGVEYNVIAAKRLVNGQWEPVGADLWAAQTAAEGKIIDLAMADATGTAHVAWSELRRGAQAEPNRIHVARLEGGRWAPVGGPLNVAPTGHANHLAMTVLDGAPLVAWQERSLAGNSQIYTKVRKGGEWIALGGSLNVNPAPGEAGRPAAVSDGTRLWLAWTEGGPGERATLHVRSLDKGIWSEPSTPLNAAPGEGAADSPALTVAQGRPVLLWAEKNRPPATKQVYAKELP